MRRWAKSALEILKLWDTVNEVSHKVLILRYEDLYSDLEHELRRILDFLGLPLEAYDFEAAKTLPVRGSSTLRKTATDKVHWAPVERASDFQPLNRWRHWRRSVHERFNWIAGPHLETFGYEPVRFGGVRLGWALANVLLDLRWWLIRAPRMGLKQLVEHARLVLLQWGIGTRRARPAQARHLVGR